MRLLQGQPLGEKAHLQSHPELNDMLRGYAGAKMLNLFGLWLI